MNDQKIYEHIAREPGIRAVRLADLLDQDLEDVKAALTALIVIGDVDASDGVSPAGVACKLYTLTDKFKATSVGQAAMAKAEAAKSIDPMLGKVDRAIAYITEHGSATSAQLHAVMGLESDVMPSVFLSSAVRDGVLKKDGKDWTLGDGKPAAEDPAAHPYREPLYGRSAQRHDTRKAKFDANTPAEMPDGSIHVPVFKDTKPQDLPRKPVGKRAAPVKREEVPNAATVTAMEESRAMAAARAEPVVPIFRAGLWSDGTIELQRNGKTVAVLMEDEASFLTRFLDTAQVPKVA